MGEREGRLAGKVALISGTGGGQGRVAAELFAREGAHVVGCDINGDTAAETAEIVRAAGLEMISMEGSVDLADPDQVQAWVQRALDAHGGIDILYNNASLPRLGPFPEVPIEDYRFTVRNEIDVVWFPAQAVWPHLVQRGGGNIVNIGSIAGIVGLRDMGQSAHALAKGAVIGLTAQLAAEGAPVNIRVNCISPGVINAPPIRELLKTGDDSPMMGVIRSTMRGEPGEPEDIVNAALYLASDEARWVTGTHLVVDGGSSVLI
jgi:meso-butanediol dehydrogenase/(S,S)-butanediol dehydrogenase/diacetyl reductase